MNLFKIFQKKKKFPKPIDVWSLYQMYPPEVYTLVIKIKGIEIFNSDKMPMKLLYSRDPDYTSEVQIQIQHNNSFNYINPRPEDIEILINGLTYQGGYFLREFIAESHNLQKFEFEMIIHNSTEIRPCFRIQNRWVIQK